LTAIQPSWELVLGHETGAAVAATPSTPAVTTIGTTAGTSEVDYNTAKLGVGVGARETGAAAAEAPSTPALKLSMQSGFATEVGRLELAETNKMLQGIVRIRILAIYY
jgi:hypothetical protein